MDTTKKVIGKEVVCFNLFLQQNKMSILNGVII